MSAIGADSVDSPAGEDGRELRRAIGPGLLVLFVIGDILGTGIYATTGKVGGALWLPFVIGFVVAVLTAASYVELVGKPSGRQQECGGPRLAAEPLPALRVARHVVPQCLHRHCPAQSPVVASRTSAMPPRPSRSPNW